MKKGSDPRAAVFERAASRLKVSGRRRKIGRLYFLGVPLKRILCEAEVAEGTLKRDLTWWHGRLGTSSRAEFVHIIYRTGGLRRG